METPIPAPFTPPAPEPVIAEIELLRNEVNWLTLTLLGLARTLELPSDKLLRDLETWAGTQMAELKKLRG